MFWRKTRKKFETITNRLNNSFSNVRSEIADLKKGESDQDKKLAEFKDNIVPKAEIKLMIENEILNVQGHTPQTPRTPMRKKADKLLNKAEIMHEIGSMLLKGLSTTEACNQLVNIKQLCRKSCFFKYLKIVREKGLQTPRTKITN
ncbi:hypothetical protein ES703_24873 [subsurface metagenome]